MTLTDILTERSKAVWSAGDWNEVAPLITPVSATAIDRLEVRPGDEVLDVAMGNGTAALIAAGRGATVTGLDFVPELVASARQRAQELGIHGTWVVGDAQHLPFPDDSFDRVVSCMGAMFAPDQQQAADELVRVCRPGGTIVVTAWTPEGLNGQMFMLLGSHLPPPPEGFQPPILWGTEDRVRALFAGRRVETERLMCRFEHDSFDASNEHFIDNLGPVVMARRVLEPEGRWEQAKADLIALQAAANQRTDGGLRADAEYLLTRVHVGA